MKKIDIVEKLVEVKEGMTKKEATEIVDALVDIMTEGLKEDKEVDIYGFVKLSVVHKEATTARNPKSGESIAVPAKEALKAKFSKKLKDAVNQ